jgi:hypothetical protein
MFGPTFMSIHLDKDYTVDIKEESLLKNGF